MNIHQICVHVVYAIMKFKSKQTYFSIIENIKIYPIGVKYQSTRRFRTHTTIDEYSLLVPLI